MNWVHALASWFLCTVDHIPIIGQVLGEANWAFKIFTALLFAGTIFWAKRKWGDKKPINPEAGVFTKVGTTVHNWRAGIVGTFAIVGTFIIIGSAVATGMLGVGSILDLKNGPTVLPDNNYYVAYVEPMTKKGQSGLELLLRQPNGPGAWDNENPIHAFLPTSSIPKNVQIKTGSVISLALFQNRYVVGEAVPDADPNYRRASL